MSTARRKKTEDTKKSVMEDIIPKEVKKAGPSFLLIDCAMSNSSGRRCATSSLHVMAMMQDMKSYFCETVPQRQC
jgi:hypothetical protein